MSFLAPSGWVRTTGYPQFRKGNMGGYSVIEKFYVAWDVRAVIAASPETGSVYDPSSDLPQLYGLRLQEISFSPTPNRTHAFVTLTFGPTTGGGGGGGGGNIADGDVEYVLDNGTFERPLETKTGYLTRWNYRLAAKAGVNSTPGWWSTATDTTLTDAFAVDYAWVKDDPPSEWKILEEKTKPGQEAYYVPTPVVNARIWYTDKEAANAIASDVGTRVAPADVFGIVGGEWLVTSARLNPDGKRWLVEKTYTWALSWDHDLYS